MKESLDNQYEMIRKDFSELQVAIDSYAKKADAFFRSQEMVVLAHQLQ